MEIGKEIVIPAIKNNWVFICSPFRGDYEKNIQVAKRICRVAAEMGYLPIAPHLYFTQFLDEDNDRWLGMDMGRDLLLKCSEVWVIGEKITEGMMEEIHTARCENIPIKYVPENLYFEAPKPEPYVPVPQPVEVVNTPLSVVGNMERSL